MDHVGLVEFISLLVFEARGGFGVKSAGEVKGEEFGSFSEIGVILKFLEFYFLLSWLGSLSILQEMILWGRLPLVLCCVKGTETDSEMFHS